MSAQPSYQNTKAEEYARWRRRDHANIEAMQNLVIAEIARLAGIKHNGENPDDDNRLGFEMPTNVRSLVSALQGTHGGGEVAFEPFERSYQSIGAQLQFTGTADAIEARVRRWVNDLLTWQREAGFELFSVIKGGEIIGTRPDGSPIRQASTFIDNLKPKADDAVQRARASELWKGNPQKGIKAHPGKALAAQVEWLRRQLPELKPEPEPEGAEKKAPARMPAGEYAEKQENRIVETIEAVADGIEERDGDADIFLEKIEKLVRKMRDSRRKTAPARRSWIMPSDDAEPTEQARSGNTNKGHEFDPPADAHLGDKNVTQVDAKTPAKTQISEVEKPENEPSSLEWALAFASQGVGVFPLKSREKIPLGKLVPHGVKDASTDEATITRWFDTAPTANLGIAMGGKLRLLAVDVDPRAGGDANLESLCEAHGHEWLETFTVKTGGGGWHFLYRLPEGVEVHRGKLAPGIDLKAAGGYLVAPPSIHPSGQRYEVEKNVYIAEAPAWLLEELTRRSDDPPAKVVDFQERRATRASAGPAIVEGERNERLFKVGCALWGKGEVASRAELLQRLMETNVERVSPPLDSDEVYKIAESISSRYTRGVPIEGSTL